jgi:secreted trypsin-like serine protease
VDSTLTTYNEIVMSLYIRPICLPPTRDPSSYEVGWWDTTIEGWRCTSVSNVTSIYNGKILRRLHLPVANLKNCQKQCSAHDTKKTFCVQQMGQDTCSGVPYMIQRDLYETLFITGLMSWRDNQCGYGVFTKITNKKILKWINSRLQ